MDSPEHQRRKRKRFSKPTNNHFPPVRSLLYFFTFFLFFVFIFRHHTTSFHHLLSISTSTHHHHHNNNNKNNNLQNIQNNNNISISGFFKIESKVSFPDHILLLISKNTSKNIINSFQCVYKTNVSDPGHEPTRNPGEVEGVNMLSVEEYSDDRFLVRCPLPRANVSSLIGLKRPGPGPGLMVFDSVEDKLMNTWDNLAYEAVLDRETNTVLVFVKGISHRQDKESDPTQFTCLFGSGDWEGGTGNGNGKYVLSSRAVTAAQEVVRCVLPRSIVMHPELARGVRASVSFRMPRYRGRANRVVVPSVAKISSLGLSGDVEKHELCVCTMLWNQAHSIREWITYHSWLGVEKWFIYDNNSDDEIQDVIKDLDFEGYNVSRHVWPWIKTQEAGFSHCAMRAKRECNWVSFMDVDEFYYFPYNAVSGFPGQGSLRTLVSNFTTSSSIGEIRTSCHSFGPSGLTSRPKKGVTVGYTCRLQSPERHKSIIRPDALDTTLMNVVHHFHLQKGFTYTDLPQSTAVINHYKYQVWEVFRAKFYRRVATYVADWTDSQNEGSRDRAPGLGTEPIEPPDWRLQFCEVWDTGLRDFILTNLADVSTGILPWDRSM